MRGRKNRYMIPQPKYLTGNRIHLLDALYFITKKFDPDSVLTSCRINIYYVSPHSESAALKTDIIS